MTPPLFGPSYSEVKVTPAGMLLNILHDENNTQALIEYHIIIKAPITSQLKNTPPLRKGDGVRYRTGFDPRIRTIFDFKNLSPPFENHFE